MKEDRLEKIEKKIDALAHTMEKTRLNEYINLIERPWRLIYINFIAGLAKGLGTAIGLTVLAAIVFYMLKSWVNLPLIGEFIARLLDVIENYR